MIIFLRFTCKLNWYIWQQFTVCYTFRVLKTNLNFEDSKKACESYNSTMVSNLLGTFGNNYHRYLTMVLNLKSTQL